MSLNFGKSMWGLILRFTFLDDGFPQALICKLHISHNDLRWTLLTTTHDQHVQLWTDNLSWIRQSLSLHYEIIYNDKLASSNWKKPLWLFSETALASNLSTSNPGADKAGVNDTLPLPDWHKFPVHGQGRFCFALLNFATMSKPDNTQHQHEIVELLEGYQNGEVHANALSFQYQEPNSHSSSVQGTPLPFRHFEPNSECNSGTTTPGLLEMNVWAPEEQDTISNMPEEPKEGKPTCKCQSMFHTYIDGLVQDGSNSIALAIVSDRVTSFNIKVFFPGKGYFPYKDNTVLRL